MTLLQFAGLASLALQLSHAFPTRPFGALRLSDLVQRDGMDFTFAAIGDSWGSGVQYSKETQYDDNSSGCQRLKNGWATVVRDHGKEWGPEGFEPKLCFEACSGRRMEHMGEELDKCVDQRPKITIMEVGGNNANFYPMADNCLFHQWGFSYGKYYEDDDPNNPEGACRKSIKEVRQNIEKIEAEYKDTIQMWKNHRASQGNDATLFTIGYGQFFAMNDECDDWSFVLLHIFKQKVKKAMRQEFNDMVDLVNKAIESATKSFNDPKIQYIDINPAFEGHRFCEPGHSYNEQFNSNNKVWLWNRPVAYHATLKQDDATLKSWDLGDVQNTDPPSEDELAGFDQYDEAETKREGDDVIRYVRNKDKPGQVLEIRTKENEIGTRDTVARTLHPTADGHNAMGTIIANELKKTQWPAPDPNLPPLPPVNNKALSIIMEKDGDHYNWIFYETPRGESAGCDTDKKPVFKGPDFSNADIDHPPNPSGDYNMDVWGRPCKWRGNGENPGELICNDEHISCQTSTRAPTVTCSNGRIQHEGAFCEFYMKEDQSPPPASAKTKALSIVMEMDISQSEGTTISWVFFATGIGKAASCDKNGATRVKDISGPLIYPSNHVLFDDPPNPIGTFKLNVHGEDCEYRNGNTNPGGLFCGDKKYDCYDDPARHSGADGTQTCIHDGNIRQVYHHPVVYCEW